MGISFWGAQVIGGESLVVPPRRHGQLIQISTVALEEPKKDKTVESVSVFLTIDTKKFVIGTLSATSVPQIRLNMVIDKGFELSHNCFNANVYIWGHRVWGQDAETVPLNIKAFHPASIRGMIVPIKKKRLDCNMKTPASTKKLKAGTSQKTDGKKESAYAGTRGTQIKSKNFLQKL